MCSGPSGFCGFQSTQPFIWDAHTAVRRFWSLLAIYFLPKTHSFAPPKLISHKHSARHDNSNDHFRFVWCCRRKLRRLELHHHAPPIVASAPGHIGEKKARSRGCEVGRKIRGTEHQTSTNQSAS